MNKKIIGIIGIVAILLFTTVAVPVIAEDNDDSIFGKKRIIAIGTFAHCEEDKVIYGYVLIGFHGLRPFFNSKIQICDDSISRIIMTNHLLNCVYFVE
jgi:hypothetical protein